MKENKLVEMWNRIEILGSNVQQIIQELQNLKDLSIGTMQLVKNFPDYEDAVNKLKEELKKQTEKAKKEKENVEQQLDKG
tara:strand:+ start:937 stop:1176 length:240 start_codon:yes stop_codon:yes gene_type:complete